MEMKLDFLRFTVKPLVECEDVLSWFRDLFPELFDARIMTECQVWEKFQHYDFCIAGANRILIYYDSAIGQNKGVCVSIPSSGMWIIKEIFGFDHFLDFLFEIVHRSHDFFRLRFTRLDLCFDDFDYKSEGHFVPEDFGRLVHEQRLVCYSQFRSEYHCTAEDVQFLGSKKGGYTFYLGSRQSGRFLRIYDKLAESQKKYKEYENYVKKHPTSTLVAPQILDCIRYEFEIKDKYANNLVFALLDAYSAGSQYYFKDFVDSWFRILEKPVDHRHTERGKVWDVWSRFCDLGFCEEFNKPDLFVLEKKPVSYSAQQDWILKSVLPALSAHILVNGSLRLLQEYALDLIRDDELPDKYKQMIFEACNCPFDQRRDFILNKFKNLRL